MAFQEHGKWKLMMTYLDSSDTGHAKYERLSSLDDIDASAFSGKVWVPRNLSPYDLSAVMLRTGTIPEIPGDTFKINNYEQPTDPGDSGGGSNGGSDRRKKPEETGFKILVNGKTETAATATTTREGDKTVTTVVIDDHKIDEILAQEGNKAVVTIPVMSGADVVTGTLNGQTVKNMASKDAVLEIKTGQVTYTLPASQINIDALLDSSENRRNQKILR